MNRREDVIRYLHSEPSKERWHDEGIRNLLRDLREKPSGLRVEPSRWGNATGGNEQLRRARHAEGRWLSVKRAAVRLDVAESEVVRLIHNGQLDARWDNDKGWRVRVAGRV